jgi:CBS domain-containing protein
MIAKDIMTRTVITVSATTRIDHLAKILVQNRISGAPVVDKRGKILGIVSEADIVMKKGRQARSIMSRRAVAVEEETPVEEIASLMARHNIKRLPVMHTGKVVGIVSRADIVRAVALGEPITLHAPIYDL